MGGANYYKEMFSLFKTMRKKQNLASDLGIQKKIGVTMHFSGIIKLQFGKKKPYIALHFTAF